MNHIIVQLKWFHLQFTVSIEKYTIGCIEIEILSTHRLTAKRMTVKNISH